MGTDGIVVEQGVVITQPNSRFGYFGWPTVTRMDNGNLLVAASGMRTEHVCPWGKTILLASEDEGQTWTPPQILNNSEIDDRDAGIVNLGGNKVLVSWFTSDTRKHLDSCIKKHGDQEAVLWKRVMDTWTEKTVQGELGSWIRLTQDGRNWGDPIKIPVNAPHGPARLKNGDLLYLGKGMGEESPGDIRAVRSVDDGKSWEELGIVPNGDGAFNENFHEPHVVETPSGKLLGLIRYEYADDKNTHTNFSLFQTESEDGGITWSQSFPLGFHGSPPHLVLHPSGAIVGVYGYRLEPYGQRAMISMDEGETWASDIVLREDGPDGDLGYPSSAVMPDGDIFTVYYQKFAPGEKCSLLWTRWKLPEG